IVVGSWQNLPVRMHLYPGWVTPFHILLEAGPEARQILGKVACSILAADSPKLRSKSAQIVSLPSMVVESWQIDMLTANTVVIACRTSVECRKKPFHMKSHLLAEIFPNNT